MQHRIPRPRRTQLVGGASLFAVAALALAAPAGAATSTTRPAGGFPGTSGQVASISGTSMEVQGTSSQTTVNWSSTTTFSKTATVTSTSVAAGDCVTIVGSTAKGKITARTVSISQPVSGTCTGGIGGGGFGGFSGGGSGTPPSGSRPRGRWLPRWRCRPAEPVATDRPGRPTSASPRAR